MCPALAYPCFSFFLFLLSPKSNYFKSLPFVVLCLQSFGIEFPHLSSMDMKYFPPHSLPTLSPQKEDTSKFHIASQAMGNCASP